MHNAQLLNARVAASTTRPKNVTGGAEFQGAPVSDPVWVKTQRRWPCGCDYVVHLCEHDGILHLETIIVGGC